MLPSEHSRTVHDVPVSPAPQSSSQENVLTVCKLIILYIDIAKHTYFLCSIIHKMLSSSHDVPAEYSTINHARTAKSSKRSPTTVRTYVIRQHL